MKITPRLDDMRLFSALAERGTFTGAASQLGVTKQTVSRRLIELEQALGVELVRRTTRRVTLTDLGRAYAARCDEVIRLADEANSAITTDARTIAGTLRVTADHTLGELLVHDVVSRFARTWARVRVEVLLTARKVDLLEEGFDAAFRVGAPPDVHHLASRRLGPAHMWTVASPEYLEHHGVPRTVEDLAAHACLAASPDARSSVWPLKVGGRPRLVPVASRILTNDVPTVRRAALSGLGLAHLPSTVVHDDVVQGRLRRVLPHLAPEVGGLHVVYPHSRLLAPKVQAFVTLAIAEAKRKRIAR